MEKYGQYCPIARSLEVLGNRWTLLIIRDMLFGGACHFNQLSRGLPRLSRSVLADRLRQLQEAGIIERREKGVERRPGYFPTEAGEDLRPVIETLLKWGASWAFGEPDEEELDPVLLMWWMRSGVRFDRLPADRTVAQFDFHGVDESFWLILDRSDASLCLKRPRFDIDLWITADLPALFQVWLGRMEFSEAVEDGEIDLNAVPSLTRAFPTWFTWSPTSDTVRTAVRHRG
ncbi:MAG: helix-turn-helix domain-containing protein [Trueperaceae bacterium]